MEKVIINKLCGQKPQEIILTKNAVHQKLEVRLYTQQELFAFTGISKTVLLVARLNFVHFLPKIPQNIYFYILVEFLYSKDTCMSLPKPSM